MTRLISEQLPNDVPDEYDPGFLRSVINLINRGLARDFKPLHKPQVVSAATASVDTNVDIVYVDYTVTGTVTVTIPDAALMSNRRITIKDRGGSASINNITVTCSGSDLLDGSATFVMAADYESIDIVSDGSDWSIV